METVAAVSPSLKPIPWFDFDVALATTAEARWGPIFDALKAELPDMRKELNKVLADVGSSWALSMLKIPYWFHSAKDIYHWDEIVYIAKRLELGPFWVLVIQLYYEAQAGCTTAIFDKPPDAGQIFVRTMDWPLEFLKRITIGLRIKCEGVLIGEAITWLGFVGYFTATNCYNAPGAGYAFYTVAINFRCYADLPNGLPPKRLLSNLGRTLEGHWPASYLIRDLIDKAVPLQKALDKLSHETLIAPCYFTVFDSLSAESCILTRETADWKKRPEQQRNGKISLFQTNSDWDINTEGPFGLRYKHNILWSKERCESLNKLTRLSFATPAALLDVLIKDPNIFNSETVYVMTQESTPSERNTSAYTFHK